MTEQNQPYGGYANQASYEFELVTSNNEPLYRVLVAYGAECLRRVPSMTDQTLGRNIKDTVAGFLHQYAEGEPLRLIGWGDHITVPDEVRPVIAELATILAKHGGIAAVSETDVAESWREVCEEARDEAVAAGEEGRLALDLHLDMVNAAFTASGQPGAEAARILRVLADRLEHQALEAGSSWGLLDTNGNRVGSAAIVEADD